MTDVSDPPLAATRDRPGRLARLVALARDALVGAFLCAGPVTAVIALGWLTRRQGHAARTRLGVAEDVPGWILGPREWRGRRTGAVARGLGGLSANIRSGLMALVALMVWTLPFTLLWLGAWWAGWENSFNKGYEQAFVGPTVFLTGAVVAAILLPALPLMLSHLAVEDRLSAAFELRRLRSVLARAGWRIPALALVVAACALPFTAARGLITTAPDWAPWIADLTPDELAGLKGRIALGLGGLAFLTAWIVRALAARIYARAAADAAGLRPGLWDGALATEGARPARAGSRLAAGLWYGLAMTVTLALSFQILAGQFLDHAWRRWSFHPALTLPWAG